MGATVTLKSRIDSAMVDGIVTDTSGIFQFRAVPRGNYILEAGYIGFYPGTWNMTVTDQNINRGELVLEPSEILLGEVTVTARKPVLIYELDKQVYNVGEDILSESGYISELLQNIPSITVDIDGKITLRNSGNITFFVNGRPSAMLRRDASSVLHNMPASSIDRIEIITNPSARYRPEGVSGIINFVMKKDTGEGLSG